MSMRINQNVLSMQTYSTLANTSSRMEKSIEKLSSGMRINRAGDDAAGLAISEKMRRQIRGLNRATLNAQDSISLIQTAEGALNESHSILQRMRELAIQASNDTLTTSDRLEIQKEVSQLRDDLNRIANNTEFNTKRLLDGSSGAHISASSNYIRGMVSGQPGAVSGEYDVSISLLQAGISEMQRTQIFTVNDDKMRLAQGHTQLQSIAQFYDANGVFALETPLSLTITGNAKSAAVQLDAQMTLNDVAAAIQNATSTANGLDIRNTQAAVINTVQSKMAGVGGYLEIVSGDLGDNGKIGFAGDQRLIDAFGFGVSREAANSRTEVTLRDAYGNVRQIRTETDTAVGLLDGIDVSFESQPAQIAGGRGLEAGLYISSNQSMTVSIGEHNVTLGAAAGHWTMEGLMRNFNHQIQEEIGTGSSDLMGLEARVVNGEIRLDYTRPATATKTIDTIIRITDAPSQGGALGFVDGNYSGFVDGEKDPTKVEWGFTKFDNSVEEGGRVIISVGDGVNAVTITVMTRLGTTELTDPDMRLFTDFQSHVNNTLSTYSVAVRVDQIGGAMAFTSLRVGNENPDNEAAINSIVTLNMHEDGVEGEATHKWFQELGLSEGTARGFGDRNFRMRVVDNSLNFHIGAEQGQNMTLGLREMTARALGVDNLDLSTIDGASAAIGRINKAIDAVSAERSRMGAVQNRLEHAINNLRNTSTNLSAAEARIRDTDIATEMMEFTRNQIVSQSGQAMMAQANMIPQNVLQLIQ